MLKKLIIFFILLAFTIFEISGFVLAQDQNKKRGIELLNTGEFRKAIEELEKAILKNPSDAEALFYLGVAYRKLGSGQLENALSGISQALRIKPNDPEWQYELAQVYDEMDKSGISLTDTTKSTFELAVEAYQVTIHLNPNILKAHLSLGELYFRKGKYELAAEEFHNVIRIDQTNVTAYSYLVDCLCKLERYNEAIENLNKWINLDPQNSEPYNLKAKIYWIQGEYEDAKQEYNQVLKINPSNELAKARIDSITIIIQNRIKIDELLTRGDIFFQARQYEQAIAQFEKIRRIDPNNIIANERLINAKTRLSDYWFNRGLNRVRNNDLERAVENFNKALEYAQNRNQIDIILRSWQDAQITLGERAQMYRVRQRGQTFIIQGEYSLARSFLEVVYRESEDTSGIRVALDTLEIAALYNIARNKEKEGFWIGALTFYGEIFRNDSTYKDSRFRIAKVNGDLAYLYKKWENAERYYLKAIQIDATKANTKELPDNKSIVDKLREVSFKQKNQRLRFLGKIIVFALAVLFIGIATGAYGHSFYVKNREKFLSLINDIKNFFTGKTILALTIGIALTIIIYYFGGELYKILLRVDPKLRSFFYWAIFSIIIAVFLTILPKRIWTTFKIVSDQVKFKFRPSKNNPTLSMKAPILASKIMIKDIKDIRLNTKLLEEVNNNSKISIHGDINIKPYDETTDLDIQILGGLDNHITIHKLTFASNGEFNFQKNKNCLFVIFRKTVDSERGNKKQKNIIELNPEFQLILNKCRIFHGSNFEIPIDETKTFNVTSIGDKNHIIFIDGNNSSQIEVLFENKSSEDSIELFNDISLKELSLFDHISLNIRKAKISTIKEGLLKILFRNEKIINLNNGDFLKFKPQIVKSFSLYFTEKGLVSDFESKVSLLKKAESLNQLDRVSNHIPVIIEWLFEYNKPWAFLLLFIGWLIVNFLQPYLESFFSKLP